MRSKSTHLPKYAPAAAAIQRAAEFRGTVPIAQLQRLSANLAGGEGEIEAELALGEEMARPPFLRGHVSGTLRLTCQRCLEAFDWPLRAGVDLRLVRSETEEARWLQDYEPYLIEDDRLPLQELVEDEVLLALPFSPRCPNCAPSGTEPEGEET